jgi:hypothetical protein
VFQGAGGGANVSDLAFTSKSHGAFVLGYAADVVGGQPAVLMMSSDGGASWQPAAVSAPAA